MSAPPGPAWRADDPFLLHALDQRRGAVISDAEAALQIARRRLSVLQHNFDGLMIEVAAAILPSRRSIVIEVAAILKNVVPVGRLALRF